MKIRSAVAGLAAGGAGVAGYLFGVRRWHLRWGAADEDVARRMPLDHRVPRPTYVTNRAVSIRAAREDVWPWLAQMGEDPRGGYYSYEWIERLMGMQVHNADGVLREFQQPRVGTIVDRKGGMVVKAVDPGHSLVLGPPEVLSDIGATWTLALYEQADGTTRLLSRVRAQLPPGPRGWVWLFILDPGQFLMERRMLLEIKRRAEALAAARATAELPSVSRSRPAA